MKKISNCEKMIMSVIWAAGEHPDLTSVMTNVNQRYGKKWRPQTISTFIARLAKKGYLNVYRQGRYSYYMPLISLEEYRQELLNDMVNTLFSGNPEELKKQVQEMYGA